MEFEKEISVNKIVHDAIVESPSEAIEHIDLLLQDHKAGWLTSQEVLNRIMWCIMKGQMVERTNTSL